MYGTPKIAGHKTKRPIVLFNINMSAWNYVIRGCRSRDVRISSSQTEIRVRGFLCSINVLKGQGKVSSFHVCFNEGVELGEADMGPEPEFVNLLRSPGIDFQPGGPVRQPYLTYKPARLYSLAESIPGILKCLQIRAQFRYIYRGSLGE
jgi:hypothetical protein